VYEGEGDGEVRELAVGVLDMRAERVEGVVAEDFCKDLRA
jgi:hypothetical protein